MRRAKVALLACVLAALAGFAGCSKEGPATPSASVAATPADALAAHVAAWKAAGLAPGAFARGDDEALGGGHCQAGLVSDVEVVVCRHADAAAAERARGVALGTVGDATGLVAVRGADLLIAVDRAGKDREGRTLNAIERAFGK